MALRALSWGGFAGSGAAAVGGGVGIGGLYAGEVGGGGGGGGEGERRGCRGVGVEREVEGVDGS